jgi:UTP--glucose-1-phosphate uridylyltransferase
MEITTGIIAAAGSGTRMLPITLAYPKELLPIINKPAIQLIIEEFIEAGLKKIIVVTGENWGPLRRQYDLSNRPRGQHKSLEELAEKLANIDLIFEQQRGPYGNGTPLMVAGAHIGRGERFIYAYGDDIIKSEVPFARRLIEKHLRTGALVAGVQPVAREQVNRYGIAELGPDGQLLDLVEKPSPEEARSNLAVFGRFLLSDEIIQILTETPLGRCGELWLTDALRQYIKRGGQMVAEPIADGRWFTIGDPTNYLKTLLEYAFSDPEMRAALEPQLRELIRSSDAGP